MNFDIEITGRPSTRRKSIVKKLNSPAIMLSGISTIFLPSDPNELCDRRKLLPKEKQAGNNSDKIKEEIVVIFDNFLENKCISEKQDKQNLIKCNLLHTNKKLV